MRSVASMEKGECNASLGVATYGSLVFQLKESHREANGTCDFVMKAMRVVSKTMVVTICLVCLSTVPIVMLIMGMVDITMTIYLNAIICSSPRTSLQRFIQTRLSRNFITVSFLSVKREHCRLRGHCFTNTNRFTVF